MLEFEKTFEKFNFLLSDKADVFIRTCLYFYFIHLAGYLVLKPVDSIVCILYSSYLPQRPLSVMIIEKMCLALTKKYQNAITQCHILVNFI